MQGIEAALTHKHQKKLNTDIAIVGMGCIFPGAWGSKDFWRLITHGEDAITDVPPTHWSAADYYDKNPGKADHTYCTRGGFLAPLSYDPTEFGIPPNSLEAIDTSQLLSLIGAKMALEDAGYGENGRDFDRDRTSVILGVTGTQELVIPLSSRLGHPHWRRALEACGIPSSKTDEIVQKISEAYVPWKESSFPGLLGNVVAGRISNRLNLGGTNTVVDAACASSLSAVHMAILELLAGRGDMMITGGVDTLNDIFMHMCFAKTGVLSHSGDARPFSEKADGTVLGEGIGILILKRLTDARKAGDRIYAVIKTMASSSDGRSQSIYAPSAAGQIKALRKAYENAGFSASTVQLIEAHGTGTRVGDAVEFESLKTVFAASGADPNQCALGSIKSMIGHTKAAAGAAGLIKAALALYHKTLPPTIKAETPDPKLNINQSPFYLNGQSKPWFSTKNHPRRAAVSAFGFGGSNFHTVLEEDPLQDESPAWDGSVMLAAFSARTIDALLEQLNTFREILQKDDRDSNRYFHTVMTACKESCHTFSHETRFRFTAILQRSETFAEDWQHRLTQSIETLKKFPLNRLWNIPDTFFGHSIASNGLAFVFPGQGSQYPNMGKDLVCCFPEARHTLEYMQTHPAMMTRETEHLLHYIYPPPAHLQPLRVAREKLTNTHIAQPAIGAISLSMLKILERFGIQPAAVCGHSYGELTALYAAGCITQEALISLSVTRGHLMEGCPEKGAMLAVRAPIETLAPMISRAMPEVILANRNAPEQGVLSGSVSAIEKARAICHEKGFQTVRLPVSSAFHSPFIASAAEPFQAFVKTIDFSEARIPVFANTTGTPYPAQSNEIRKLLGRQMMNPVDFMTGIENMYASGIQTFLEVGPKSVLTGLIRTILDTRDFNAMALDSSAGTGFGLVDLARCLCRISAAGHFVNLSQWEDPVVPLRKQRMSIPMTGANIKPVVKPAVRIPESAENESLSHNQPSVSEKKVMKKTQISSSPVVINDALKAVQEGMKSMQQLQAQTARTHQKFLETQSEAGRTLQSMMDQTRRMAEIAMGISQQDRPATSSWPDADPTLPGESIPEQKTPIHFSTVQATSSTQSHTTENRPIFSPTLSIRESSEPASPLHPASQTAPQNNALHSRHTSATGPQSRKERPSNRDTEQKLLEIVSQLTGYPTEMLDRQMDIESDLGIDSIKRVEILSALEERIPDLPAIPPETMGTLKTLGQIADYLENQMATDDPSGNGHNMRHPGHTSRAAHTASVSTEQSPSRQSPERSAKDGIETRLLEIVSQLTGYPTEMLDRQMDIESDLGIDSIKRVEILSALEERIPDLPAIPPETMGTLKTLGQIADYLGGQPANAPSITGTSPLPDENVPKSAESREHDLLLDTDRMETAPVHVDRKIITLTERAPAEEIRLRIPSDRTLFVMNDSTGLGQSMVEEFTRRKIRATLLEPDLLSQQDPFHTAGGLILIHDMAATPPLDDAEAEPIRSKVWNKADEDFLKQAFDITRKAAKSLMASAAEGGAVFATITGMDGAFGFQDGIFTRPLQGALAGLAKTAAVEWDTVCCHAIDIAPEMKSGCSEHEGDFLGCLTSRLIHEIMQPGPVELGIRSKATLIPVLQSAALPEGDIALDEKDVVVITGGARGVTAASAYALAEYKKPVLVIIGRSPAPQAEPQWLASLTEETGIKKALLENEFNGQAVKPRELETAFKKHMANREMLRNLKKMKDAGASIYYYSADVRQADTIASILTEVREKYGPVKGLIHGAGVLQDRLIQDKTPEQFNMVFDTKAGGLRVLLEATRTDDLKYLVLFSSISARQGNRGQVDYAMASEVLNKVARLEALRRPDCRVISINWGPWDGGMVSPALKKEFTRRNIELIPLDTGSMYMLHEMAGSPAQPVEVVIGAEIVTGTEALLPESPRNTAGQTVNVPKDETLAPVFDTTVNVEHFPVLSSHIIGRKPVVPFALMTEWLAHGGLQNHPGLRLFGIDDMRLYNGIKINRTQPIRLFAGKTGKTESDYTVPMEIRDQASFTESRLHCRATIVMTEKEIAAPIDLPLLTTEMKKPEETSPYLRTMKEVYEKILFHGPLLRGIRKISHCSSERMTADLLSAPAVIDWIAQPLRNQWLMDPLIMDAMFQMGSLWCFEEKGVVSLPNYFAAYRQYRESFPQNGVKAIMMVKDVTDHKMQADFVLLDSREEIVATLTGYEAIMSDTLNNAFKPEGIHVTPSLFN
jgi:acyl transferase domain-containing protein/NAD(P)-dependent dehydrogenase (short-subunit alcohol dehydrogenase family)